jgi:hypothetical protein
MRVFLLILQLQKTTSLSVFIIFYSVHVLNYITFSAGTLRFAGLPLELKIP